MALSIKNQEIIGEIDNLEDKLEGKLPVDRLELLYLVNSWGRHYKFGVNDMQINDIHSMNRIGMRCSGLLTQQITLNIEQF